MEAVIYHGSKQTREQLMGAHWRGKEKASSGCPVMITSYEIVIRDMSKLRKVPWKVHSAAEAFPPTHRRDGPREAA